MTDINTHLRKKAFGILKSIEAMNEKERNFHPSEDYGKNYNKLRDLCLKHNPDLKEFLPPMVSFGRYNSEIDKATKHYFSEIHTFCSEIYHLLDM